VVSSAAVRPMYATDSNVRRCKARTLRNKDSKGTIRTQSERQLLANEKIHSVIHSSID